MKKFKVKKIKIKEGSFRNFFRYILTMLFSAVLFALVLIALPLTEKLSNTVKYDLVNKNDLYWSKEYELELDTEDKGNVEDDIEKTKSIIQKRLREIGVERSSISNYTKDEKQYIRVTVQTSKSEELITPLINSPFLVTIVTRKDDFDYENTEDVIAPFLEENYIKTGFTREDFRNVHITKLKNSNNEYSYFALFKTWPGSNEWEEFLQEYAGQSVGVSIDGFVTQVQVPLDQQLFAASINASDRESAHSLELLFNSGVVPLNYSVTNETELEPNIAQLDYIKLTLGILIAIVAIYAYLLFVEKTPKDILLHSGFSTVITVSSWIAYLKISDTPVDFFLLAIHMITIVALIRIIAENTESRIVVTVLVAMVASICSIFGSGYVQTFAYDLLTLMILANISLSLTVIYLFNLRKTLKV
jgi:preprotein translocase subunit SecD